MTKLLINDTMIRNINEQFSAAISDLSKVYAVLKKITESDSIEILFYNKKENYYFDKVKGTKIETKYFKTESFLGHVAKTHKPTVSQNVEKSTLFHTAIDNPFKINIKAQIVIPVIFDGKIEGFIRCSRESKPYSHKALEILKHIMNSFKDIFLNERHQIDIEILRHPFTLETVEVYQSIKEIKAVYAKLLKHTQSPEIEKLLKEGQSNLDSVFRYLNPNMDNVAKVKYQLRQFKKDENDTKSLKVLIADDVMMNVKILNSMLNSDSDISEIKDAYDGNQTMEVLEASCSTGKKIDVLFLDHHMPGKLGLEIAKSLKSNVKCSPIIVSITNDPEAIENNLGLYDYHLSKPFSKMALDDILKEIKRRRGVTH
jgi:CheY-like chemotaxis protein